MKPKKSKRHKLGEALLAQAMLMARNTGFEEGYDRGIRVAGSILKKHWPAYSAIYEKIMDELPKEGTT